MRQALGPKKHKKCEEIAGAKYDVCLVRGGQTHYRALCVLESCRDKRTQDIDVVNYKTREWWPYERDGIFIKS